MSRTVDERVVEMRFDNANFEKNVQTSMSTLDKLKRSLNLSGASKGLENIGEATNKVRFDGMTSGIETVRAKFSALEVVGITALMNITNAAMAAGRKLVSAITIDPVKDGFAEYETQMNSVQTILANTQKEGTNVKVVNAALDELNHYADKTIYNFTEMTRNIGTFTAAGVKLDTSVSAIQGIANLAAVSGSTSQQASTAMYQLSQAIASGTVKLMDWNSVVNAGMGGQVFQDALIRTSEHLQTGAKAAIAAKGSFRESLQTGWLTTEVLTQTLDQFSTAADTQKEYEAAVKKFIDQGYSKEEAKQMADMAKTAGEAATKVKTFSQLIDTLKEALGSGWTETWRTVIGDFEEARELWTSVSNVLSDAINRSSDARNAIVKEWADLGGRKDLIDSFKNVFNGIGSIVKPVKEAFQDIFPPITSKKLFAFTEGLKNLTSQIKISDSTAKKLKSTFSGLFSVVSVFGKILASLGTAFGKLITSDGVKALVNLFLTATAAIGDFFTALNKGFDSNGFTGILTTISDGISSVLKAASDGALKLGNTLPNIGNRIIKVVSQVWQAIKDIAGWLKNNISLGDIFKGLIGGGITAGVMKVVSVIGLIKEKLEDFLGPAKGVKDKFTETLDSIHDSLESFTTGIKATTLLTISAAIGILALSLKSIAGLKSADVGKSLSAITVMFAMLNTSFKSINKTLDKYDSKGLIKAGSSILLLAIAMKTLSTAMVKLAGLSWNEIAKGLTGVGIGIAELCLGLKAINKVKIPASTSIGLLALSESCKILGDAMKQFGNMSWSEIGHGLTGMGGALTELVIALKALNGISGFKSILSGVGLLVAVQSLSKMADSLKQFGNMSWSEIGHGLTGMGGALTEVAGISGALGKIAGLKSIIGSGSIFIVVQGLAKLATAMNQFGNMSWSEIRHGLTGMGGALTEVAIAAGVLGKLSGLSGIFGSGTIVILINGLSDLGKALKQFGGMSWNEIAKGLTGMGGALTEVAGISGVLGKMAGLSGILGAGSINVTIQGLGKLADALSKFSGLSWGEIKRGLTGMAGALAEVATVSGVLGKLGGFASLIGAGSLYVAIQGLSDLADALQKFGSMSWGEVTRGLTAMGTALEEVAAGSLVNTLSGLGAMSINKIAKPLGDLADSVKKWNGVTVPKGLGKELSTLAKGIRSFTFDGLGASALSTAAPSIGELAGSIKKWNGVTIPDGLEEGLTHVANGVKQFSLAFAGGWSLDTATGPLSDLAVAISKWNGVTIPDGLENGLKRISDGVKQFSLAFAGGWSLATVTGPLGDLAGSIKKWSDVTVPDNIETGMTSIANGVKQFTLAFAGGLSLDTVTGPLGDLAGSIKKWSDVIIPDGLETGLTSIANGIKQFSLAFAGGWSLDTAVEPLGQLAGSIKKWNGVTIPDNLETGMTQIANGVKQFSFAFLGGWSLDASVGPIGNLAGAIKKWNGVTIPDNLENGMTQIANGIKEFASAFIGGWSLDAATGPIGKLAGSIKKWNSVTIPDGLEKGLKSIANGIKSFSLAFVGGWTLDAVTGPIGTLAGSIKKWNGVTVPDSIGTQLTNLATGIKAFTGIEDISSTVSSVGKIANAMTTLTGVDFTGISGGITSFSTSITNLISATSSLSGVGDSIVNNIVNPIVNANTLLSGAITTMINSAVASLSGCSSKFSAVGQQAADGFITAISSANVRAVSAITGMMSAMGLAISSNSTSVSASFTTIMNTALNIINVRRGLFAIAGSGLMTSLRTGISSGSNGVTSIVNTTVSRAKTIVDGKRSQFNQSGRSLMTNLCNGLRSGGSGASSAIYSALSSCSGAIRSFYYSFYSAGGYLGDGLTEGIASRESAAYRAGYRLGQQAVQGEKDGQKSHSPSKLTIQAGKWLGEGLVIGMDKMGKSVYKSGKSMGANAVQSISSALSMIGDANISDDTFTPTIQPVVDMAELQNGSRTLSIGADLSARLLSQPVASLQDMLNSTQDSINASNNQVIDAINALRADLNAFYSDDEKEIALYLNSKKVASTLAKDMNRQLAVLQKRGAY